MNASVGACRCRRSAVVGPQAHATRYAAPIASKLSSLMNSLGSRHPLKDARIGLAASAARVRCYHYYRAGQIGKNLTQLLSLSGSLFIMSRRQRGL